MKVIIAGGRDKYLDPIEIQEVVHQSGFIVSEVVCGGASGIDASGARYAKVMGIPCRVFDADWDTHGRAAGPIRNSYMAKYADALILIWDGSSKGSADMLKKAKSKELQVYEINLETAPETEGKKV